MFYIMLERIILTLLLVHAGLDCIGVHLHQFQMHVLEIVPLTQVQMVHTIQQMFINANA